MLHVPDAVCNIIGSPVLDEYSVVKKSDALIITSGANGRNVAYLKTHPSLLNGALVTLSGPPIGPSVGPSPFVQSQTYQIAASWANSDRQKFLAWDDKLSPEETEFLKEHFESEAKFLARIGLNPDWPEDRRRGRKHLRSHMAENQKRLEEIDHRLETQAHLADHLFTAPELEAISRRHGSSTMFFFAKQLNMWQPDSVKEAQQIAQRWVKEDEIAMKTSAPSLNGTSVASHRPAEPSTGRTGHADPKQPSNSHAGRLPVNETNASITMKELEAALFGGLNDDDYDDDSYDDFASIIYEPDEDEIEDTMNFLAAKARDPDISQAETQRILDSSQYYIDTRLAPEDSDDEDRPLPNDLFHNAHFADDFFSRVQLDWVEKDHGNVRNFMLLNGLKLETKANIEEGKRLVESLMVEEQ